MTPDDEDLSIPAFLRLPPGERPQRMRCLTPMLSLGALSAAREHYEPRSVRRPTSATCSVTASGAGSNSSTWPASAGSRWKGCPRRSRQTRIDEAGAGERVHVLRHVPTPTGKGMMTAQIAERLLYQGQIWSMCANPLNDYFAFGGVSPGFRCDCTALWRGYVGLWEIQNDRLYLLELNGTLQDGSAASLATLFPDFPERVFAHWYSGTLRIPQGRRLQYVHMGYGSTYERDLLLEIERGVVVASRVQHNGTAGSEGDGEGYRVGAVTVFPQERAGDGRAS